MKQNPKKIEWLGRNERAQKYKERKKKKRKNSMGIHVENFNGRT